MTDHYDAPEPAWRRTKSRILNLVAVSLLVALLANMCWTFTQRRRIVPGPQAPDAGVPSAPSGARGTDSSPGSR